MTGGRGPEIHLCFAGGRSQAQAWGYTVAGRKVWSNEPVPELASISKVERGTVAWQERAGAVELEPVYEGLGWVAGREVEIQCFAADGSYRVRVGQGLEMQLETSAQCTIRMGAPATDESARLSALGPGLAVALAETGTTSLHAAGIRVDERVLILLGESGAGKSTLAAEAAASGGGERLADDIVPVALGDGRLLTLPRFPQLKLRVEEQWGGEEELPVAELLVVRRDRDAEAPLRRRLEGRRSVLSLLENTVASRLFSPALSRRHLDFAIRVVKSAPISELVVPEGLARVSETLELLESGRPA